MIKKLRKDFIFIMMISLFIVMAILISIINISYYCTTIKEANFTINILYENSGQFPNDSDNKTNDPSIPDLPNGMENMNQSAPNSETSPSEPEEYSNGIFSSLFDSHWTQDTKYETSFFEVELDSSNNISNISHAYIASVSEAEISDYTEQMISADKDHGKIENFIYRIYSEDDGSSKIIAINCYQQFKRLESLIIVSVLAGLVSMLAVFLLVLFMSKKITKPAEESIIKQSQFITDAGHELKTPITIISANVDVLQLQNGSNQFTDSIKNQTKRLSSLVASLLELSKLNEYDDNKAKLSEVLLSTLVSNIAESFITLAISQEKEIIANIEPDITISGIRPELEKLTSILLDNAVKYSDGVKPISINLTNQQSKVVLSVGNSCEHIDTQKLDRIFERFYRLDSSRSRKTGGNGIGLSIAKAIMVRHNGSIKAESSDTGDYLNIIATFPNYK